MQDSVLVINCGSSSLKFSLIHPASGEAVLSGLAEKLGHADASLTLRDATAKSVLSLAGGSHEAAMRVLVEVLQQRDLAHTVTAVGHRVVHGGEAFSASTRLDDTVLAAIAACSRLAPLHNPANLLGIRVAKECFPTVPHVAVFDTAFHQTMPEHAYLYAVPMALYRDHGVRRYGFHGTSHRFVAAEAAQLLGHDLGQTALITAHLGNGASVAAVLNGHSLDTSMGLTPLEGLVMGTRSGDVDPGLLQFIADTENKTLAQVTDLLNKQSGLLGLSELSNDCRELQTAADAGHTGARVALAVFCYRLARHIAALTVALPRLDALVFTGGIGENAVKIRATVLGHLAVLGFTVDDTANAKCVGGQAGVITASTSRTALVVNTNEELLIARDTAALVG